MITSTATEMTYYQRIGYVSAHDRMTASLQVKGPLEEALEPMLETHRLMCVCTGK
jgi:hypothetical protein